MTAEKIIVGISGGVDSSVTALLLKQQGYQVEALFMKNWHALSTDGNCAWETDVADAMQVCEQLDIPLNTVDLATDYWDKVFKNFLSEYGKGRTPNPDVLCNQEIKFNCFVEHAKTLGAQKIATGHYAQILQQDRCYQLLKGADHDKDQSYFLCCLTQRQLQQALFPIGQLHKSQVRMQARQAGFITHDKKDSTGICFIGEQSFKNFLSRFIPKKPGDVKTIDGKTIATHDGIFYYTLGQRKGLGIGGVKSADDLPWYVIQKNITDNELIVAQDHDHPLLYSDRLTATNINWISGVAPRYPFACHAKIRYRQEDQTCTIEAGDDTSCNVRFQSPQRAITPGQFIVFYQENHCLGGGIIDGTD